jgi:hypothetical protein
MFNDGNYNDAYQVFRTRVADPQTDPRTVGDELRMAVQCLQNLGRHDEIDKLLEDAVAAHPKNWRLLKSAAGLYLSIEHFGYMIGGEFRRGQHRGGGNMVNSMERDRVRALQLFVQARPLALDDDEKPAVGEFFFSLADALLYDRGAEEAWRLQYLTDLTALPDYEEGWPYFRGSQGAPVDADGNPVFHDEPKNWDEAATDGQRWRWALAQAVENSPALRIQSLWRRADFLWQQFGVQTIQGEPWVARAAEDDDGDEEKDESGVYAVHTLDENETIARLAAGIKRFELPDEHNHIKLYQEIAKENNSDGENALDRLARIFENRRQYPKAADYWRRNIERFGDPQGVKKAQLDQIVGNWGQFEPISTQGAGQGATVDYRFRNGKKVRFTAHSINVAKLLDDLKRYLRSNPGQVDWQKINIENIGYRIVVENERLYLGEEVASWELDLDPRENHFDRRVTVTTPLQKAGAYYVRADMEGGNTSRIVLWVADTALVQKNLSERSLYYVADAVSGSPVAGANLEFFGYKIEQIAGNRFRVLTKNFAETADGNGIAMPDPREVVRDMQWLVIARSGNRLAYLGFQGVWGGRYYDPQYNQVRPFFITDRPVYRPDQTVHFKCWVRRAQYDQDNTSEFAGQSFPLEIYNAKNEKVWSETLKADEYGGVEAALELPSDAALGVYRIVIQDRTRRPQIYGQATFRVEEYKKPEFEVAVSAPDKPVMLGEKVTAKIKANYYFGSPVVNATVKYKITRTEVAKAWYPPSPWDWLYGEGFWWFAYDYPWYPGWSKWVGSVRPQPWWWGGYRNPPELVAEREAPIGSDGTLEVEIDTALAKAMHGDQDHQYTITAEVRDQSRRTIVGSGQVLVARHPFEVYAWVDRGYYRVGDVTFPGANARSPRCEKRGRTQAAEDHLRRWQAG